MFNLFRPRDRSHYERFSAYHESFYRFVEATSVTPFSAPALERGLAGLLVTMTRLGDPALTPPDALMKTGEVRRVALAAIECIAHKAADEHQDYSVEEAARIKENVARFGKNLVDAWEQAVADGPEGGATCYSTLDKKVKGAPLLFTGLDPDPPNPMTQRGKFRAGTSMRDVEPSVHLWKNKQRLFGAGDDDGR